MAHSRSAIKRIRQNEARRLRNRADRSRLRTQIKKFRQVVETEDIEQAKRLLPETVSLIDRMVKKGILHANAGSRHKSRLEGKLARVASS